MGQQLSGEQMQLLDVFITQQLHAGKPQAIGISLWAYAQFRFMPCQLLTALEQQPEQLQRLLCTEKPQGLSNRAVACAWLGLDRSFLFNAVLHQAAALLQQGHRAGCDAQELCNLGWATAVLNKQQHADKVLLFARACGSLWDSMNDGALTQLYQAHLWLQDHQLPAGDIKGLGSVLAQQRLKQCQNSWELQLSANVKQSSALQHSVFIALRCLPAAIWQWPPAMEQPTVDKAAVVDIVAVIAAGVKLAIEVDGPTHFVNPGKQLNGPTQHINRVLAARGYTVVSIPHWEWDALQTSAQQVKYLQRKLSAYVRI